MITSLLKEQQEALRKVLTEEKIDEKSASQSLMDTINDRIVDLIDNEANTDIMIAIPDLDTISAVKSELIDSMQKAADKIIKKYVK